MKKKCYKMHQNQYSHLSYKIRIKATPELKYASSKAHDLYNCALYQLRQWLFKRSKTFNSYPSYVDLNNLFKQKATVHENELYRQLFYVQSAQQTLKEVSQIFKAFFKALKSYQHNSVKFSGKPKLPKYLKQSTYHCFYVTNQNLKVIDDYLIINRLHLKVKLPADKTDIQRVIFKPVVDGFEMIIQYRITKVINYRPDNLRYVGIDPGVDNAFTCTSNTSARPLIINGRNIKAVNQFYNKKLAADQMQLAKCDQLETTIMTKNGAKAIYQYSKRMLKLVTWRNNKIMQFAHKATRRIVDYALSCDANTIVIGNNKNWKRSSNLGKKNNQNFIGIPHQKMIDMLIYKANLAGITVITTNESYTSQTSFLDHELPVSSNGNKARMRQNKQVINRRIKRGLFKSNQGKLINADVNASLQIIKKVFPNAKFADGIEGVVLRPIKQTIIV